MTTTHHHNDVRSTWILWLWLLCCLVFPKSIAARGLVASVYKGVPPSEKSTWETSLSLYWSYLTIALAVLSPVIVFLLFLVVVFVLDWLCDLYGVGSRLVVAVGKSLSHWIGRKRTTVAPLIRTVPQQITLTPQCTTGNPA